MPSVKHINDRHRSEESNLRMKVDGAKFITASVSCFYLR